MSRRLRFSSAVLLALLSFAAYSAHAADPPRVIATAPQNGFREVDHSLKQISVTFNQAMADKSWSWSYENSKFPIPTGTPYFTDGGTTCVLPVQLEPGREYVIWINTAKFKNFKSVSGTPAQPYRLAFRTKRSQ